MLAPAELPDPVSDAIDVWLDHHDHIAPGLVTGLHLVGSLALGDWQANSDIDVVAVLAREPSNDDVDHLRAAHQRAIMSRPDVDIDGPRVVASDFLAPPQPLARPWTLGGAFHHDAECFELNPVTWRTLRRHGITVRGAELPGLAIRDADDELVAFVKENTANYWEPVADQIEAALAANPDRAEFDPALTSWCVLGAARMLRTATTGDVVSKSAAGHWLADRYPEWAWLIDRALAARTNPNPSLNLAPDDRATVEQVTDYLREVTALVAAT